ncbi:hypothetical protein L915_06784 [Phytophthora nicotianae]|uniref:Uncharacterized protein n=1 Tax=Phytophthora nicotianae TaxID=4792 RepID=W2H1K6_PHYNI|nr:hypothetical protein L915_06784 [Phytophthora nicotianae]
MSSAQGPYAVQGRRSRIHVASDVCPVDRTRKLRPAWRPPQYQGNTYPSLRFEEVEEEKMQQFVEMTEAPAQVNQQLPENTFLCESTPGR